MKLDSEETKNLLDELAAQLAVENLRTDDVTVARLERATGRNRESIRHMLEAEIKAGRLVKVRCIDAEIGRACTAYRRPQKGTE